MTHEDLLKWAKEHKYPAIAFYGKPVKLHPVPGLPPAIQPLRYAIGIQGNKNNKRLWEVAVLVGRDEMIEALMEHINSLGHEQLEAMQKPKTALARERGIRIV